MLFANPLARFARYPDELKAILNVADAQRSRVALSQWPYLAAGATPLRELPAAAARSGIAQLHVKDESVRSPLASFKALGAPNALMRLIQRLWPAHGLDASAVIQGGHQTLLTHLTVISATDGNHGRALAAAAQTAGCQCVIVLHARVSTEREHAIAAYGAQIIRIAGNYDESVAHAERLARQNGWHVVSDTSYEGYEAVPRDVMQGYGTIAAELVEQSPQRERECAFTHVFLQGGVGGLAAGIASYLWETYGDRRPRFIVVEPTQADCLLRSACEGRPARATGSVDSVMAGLACGEASPLAWTVLEHCIDHFMTIDDAQAIAAMRELAAAGSADVPIVAGESGAAGYAGLAVLMRDRADAAAVALDTASRVLVINTEGATAPTVYAQCVGETAESVLARQQQWGARVTQ
ncbi:diaminopropionate ammonia-lyase [Paraburkholderia jirisanensis]